MTEEEWLTTAKPPGLLLGVLVGNFRSQFSDRKVRLFICGCVRQMPEHLWMEQLSSLVEYAETFADGKVSLDEVNAFRGRHSHRHTEDRTALFEQHIQNRLLTGKKLLWQMAAAQSTEVVTMRSRATLRREVSDVMRRRSLEDERRFISAIVHDLFGNPFRPVTLSPSWLTSTVVALATGIYSEKAFDQMPILADALQDAGCDNEEMLNHCRQPGKHTRGCWLVDLLTGRE